MWMNTISPAFCVVSCDWCICTTWQKRANENATHVWMSVTSCRFGIWETHHGLEDCGVWNCICLAELGPTKTERTKTLTNLVSDTYIWFYSKQLGTHGIMILFLWLLASKSTPPRLFFTSDTGGSQISHFPCVFVRVTAILNFKCFMQERFLGPRPRNSRSRQ